MYAMIPEHINEFTIRLSLEALPEEIRVISSADEDEPKYELYNEADYLGTVSPECVEKGVCWFSSDELSEDVVLKIGEAIESRDH